MRVPTMFEPTSKHDCSNMLICEISNTVHKTVIRFGKYTLEEHCRSIAEPNTNITDVISFYFISFI